MIQHPVHLRLALSKDVVQRLDQKLFQKEVKDQYIDDDIYQIDIYS